MFPATLYWLAVMAVVDGAALGWLARGRTPGRALTVLAATGAAALAGAFVLREDAFGFIRLCAWGVFAHGPAILLGAGWLLRRSHPRVAVALSGASLLGVAIAVDAFLIEPTWLEVTRFRLVSSKLDRPLKIVVLADFQTDRIGPYEREALAKVAAERADLILCPGDYLQTHDAAAVPALVEAFRAAWREAGITAPLGVWAVGGDCEDRAWPGLFEGLGVETFGSRATRETGGITLTGLTLGDSRSPGCVVAKAGTFHIAMGHAPDFAMGDVSADLLVAGHTHGGQVRLPFVGPILTLSRVPRAWAAGRTDLPGGRTLIVSRGVGHERSYAPRLRFLCRPELVVIEVIPAAK